MVERAYPQAVRSAARRAWQVTIDPQAHRLACTAPGCPGPAPTGAAGQAAQQVALAHLAAHAQYEPLDSHLRTCRCHAHGCTWHPRHRGCTGPIQLTVFRQRRGRAWHLADTCTGCAHLIPHAAPVPDPTATTGPAPAPPNCPEPVGASGRQAAPAPARVQAALPPLLQYLAAALGGRVPPGAALLALCCLLWADARGTARLPVGLLRALRLNHDRDRLVDALAYERWLRREGPCTGAPPGRRTGALSVRIADPAAAHALAALGRRERRALADATVRLLTHCQLRALPDGARLTALHQMTSPAGTVPPARMRLERRTRPATPRPGAAAGPCRCTAATAVTRESA